MAQRMMFIDEGIFVHYLLRAANRESEILRCIGNFVEAESVVEEFDCTTHKKLVQGKRGKRKALATHFSGRTNMQV